MAIVMNNEHWKFIHAEILTSSINGALQRASVYRRGVIEKERESFRDVLKSHLSSLGMQYSNGHVTEDIHIGNIDTFADQVSTRCGEFLNNGRFRIGIAQKALNLYLKYLWCLGRIPPPPHCPFDAIVIGSLPSKVRVAWTRLDSPHDYLALVKAARSKATERGQSLAEWELTQWNKKR